MEYPDLITNLPEADVPVKGLKVHMMQSKEHGLIAFMEAVEDAEVPPHSHKAQWGTVLDGEAHMTVDGELRVYQPGDSYYVEPGIVHSAKLPAGTKLIEFFEEADRFNAKP